MFYVSSIDGGVSPYVAEEYQRLREAELHAASQASSQTSSSASTSAASSQAAGIPDEVATGMAGASMQMREGSSSLGEAQPQGESEVGQSDRERFASNRQVGKTSPEQAYGDGERESKSSSPSRVLEVKEKIDLYSKLDDPIPERKPALVAKQIMASPVMSLRPDDTIETAASVIGDRRFRHVPIVSEGGQLVGIISDREVLRRKDPEKAIREVMRSNVLSAHPDTEIRQIASIMFHERIGAMPVLDENRQLVGMITRSDILRTIVNKAPLELWV